MYTYILLCNVKLQSLQIAPSKSASSMNIVFFNCNVSSNCLVFVKNKYGNAWFRRLQKSTEETAVLKQFRNFILICAINFIVDVILTYKTRF